MSESGPGAGALRDVVLALAEDPAWVATVVDGVSSAVIKEMPELATDGRLRDAIVASNAESLRLFIDMLRRSVPPEEAEPPAAAVAYAHELARRGVGIDLLLRGYHATEAAFFSLFVERVRARPSLEADAGQVVEAGAQWLFAFVGALTRGIVERYAEEHERWVRSADALRQREVRAVLAGEATDAHAVSARIRYPLDRRHLALVLWMDAPPPTGGEPVQAMLERSAAELAASLGATMTLIVGFPDGLVAAWLAGVEPAAAPHIARIPFGPPSGPRPGAACGLPASGLAGFRKSHGQAMHAYRVARLTGLRAGAVVDYKDVALTALATVDVEQARDFTVRELGSLTDESDESLRLAATLRVYLEEGSSARSAAKRLGVHENTVKNRIRSAEERVGHPVSVRVAELLLALRLAGLVRSSQDS